MNEWANERAYELYVCVLVLFASVSGNMAKEHNDKFYYRVQYDLNTHHVVLVFLLANAWMPDVSYSIWCDKMCIKWVIV